MADVEEVVAAAHGCGLATFGVQAQFRIPEGTCDLYWIVAVSGKRRSDEPWDWYVTRSAEEVLDGFTALRNRTDFVAEGFHFNVLIDLHNQGVDIGQYLCFILTFGEDDPP